MENYNNGSRNQMLQSLALTIALMVTGGSAQAEYYKWTDAEGQVHYTQKPPEEISREQVELLEVKTHVQSAQESEPGAEAPAVECGALVLPKLLPNPVERIVQLRQTLSVWQKYLDEHSGSSNEGVVKKIEEVRCGIDYANRELQALSEVEGNLQSNFEDATKELETLQQQVKGCDQLQEEGDEIAAAECRGEHRSRIIQLEKMLRTLDNSKRMLRKPQ